jgi:hypothetical protein
MKNEKTAHDALMEFGASIAVYTEKQKRLFNKAACAVKKQERAIVELENKIRMIATGGGIKVKIGGHR